MYTDRTIERFKILARYRSEK